MIKMPIHQEDKIITNLYGSMIKAPRYMKQTFTELKGEVDNNII